MIDIAIRISEKHHIYYALLSLSFLFTKLQTFDGKEF